MRSPPNERRVAHRKKKKVVSVATRRTHFHCGESVSRRCARSCADTAREFPMMCVCMRVGAVATHTHTHRTYERKEKKKKHIVLKHAQRER